KLRKAVMGRGFYWTAPAGPRCRVPGRPPVGAGLMRPGHKPVTIRPWADCYPVVKLEPRFQMDRCPDCRSSPRSRRPLAVALLAVLAVPAALARSEEHTSELQSRETRVCRLLR